MIRQSEIVLPIPPKPLRFMGEDEEQYVAIGDQLLEHVRSLAALTEGSRVVDIGCGYGRFAHALKRWPDFRGDYIGFDILDRHVTWCQENLGDERFSFQHLDVRNDRYNPKGQIEASEVDLGTHDADVAVLTSVFTHMWPDEILHYLRQLRTILRENGRAYVTAFLMNESQRAAEAEGRSRFPLHHALTDYCSYMDEEDPLHAIAYEEDWLLGQILDVGLVLAAPIKLGSWCGRRGGSFQDVLILRQDALVLRRPAEPEDDRGRGP